MRTSRDRGIAWGDYDNDGDLDLHVANDNYGDRLYRNDGNGVFTDVAGGQWFSSASGSTGNSWGDFDGDGLLDIAVASFWSTAHLFHNEVTNGNHWIEVRLVGVQSNRAAIGAHVRLTANGRQLLREVSGGDSFYCQQDLTVHFGLGSATVVDTLEVLWPSGTVQTLGAVPADQRLTLVEAPTPNCDDGNPCTGDSHDATGACVHTPVPGACDDGSVCTTADACLGGHCAGEPVNCDDGNPCSDDLCNSTSGCYHTPNTAPCSDGSACTVGDFCAGGSCAGGPPANCDDSNPCTDDSCAPATGCAYWPHCWDGNACTQDLCDAGGGCTHLPTCVEDRNEPAPAGGTVTSDFEGGGDGATPSDQIETSVTTPTGGQVTIQERPAGESAPPSYDLLNLQVTITAPPASAAEPLVLVFRLDATTLPPGFEPPMLTIFRNGTALGECTGAPGEADPDPCVASRAMLPDGDLEVRVLTSAASVWTFALPACDDNNDCTEDTGTYPDCIFTPLAAGEPCGSSAATDCDRPDICDGAGRLPREPCS